MGDPSKAIRDARRARGECVDCEAESTTYRCGLCLARTRRNRKARQERQPTVAKFQLALWHAQTGATPRDALHHAGLLLPLLRGEI